MYSNRPPALYDSVARCVRSGKGLLENPRAQDHCHMIKERGRSRNLNLNSSSRDGRGRHGNRTAACATPGEARPQEVRPQEVCARQAGI